MIDITDEVRKSISKAMIQQSIPISKYYGEVKEQGFDTPCIMIAPIGDSGSSVNYELSKSQKRKYGYQVIYFPAEKTVLNGVTQSQRKMCEVVADAIINMRYVDGISALQNLKYTISDGTLVVTFFLTMRLVPENSGVFLEILESNSGDIK